MKWKNNRNGNNLRIKDYELRWGNQKSLEASKLNGWEIFYTNDNKNNIHYRLLNSAHQVLMKKLDALPPGKANSPAA